MSLLALIKPYLMGDKWETARYVLNIGRSVPDTEYRPMYYGIIRRARRPVFLYPEYVNFPVKYAAVIHKGESLPGPLRRKFAVKYMADGRPIIWRKGMVKK